MARPQAIVAELPHAVRRIDHTWIELSDGARLGARIWLPQDSEPVPAVLEYLPYRKGDGTAVRDEPRHAYFAGHGYACVRVDMRGSGESDGVLRDEYLPQEQEDGLEVLRWIAAQPWCNGAVGMMGISWGGFNSLQIAALRPPELRAVIAAGFTDDRYADDVHYRGGCVLAQEMLSWATAMASFTGTAPDPEVAGPDWREQWLARLRDTPLYIEPWLSHQWRDEYWRHGSVCEDPAAIQCPVLAVGGWADGYTEGVVRLLADCTAPVRGLIGPWSHAYPDGGSAPGPQIGFGQECLRWWDQWLRGRETGVMDEPLLRAWMQEPVAPAPFHAIRPGRWVAEDAWPSPAIGSARMALGDRTLGGAAAADAGTGAGGAGADGAGAPASEPGAAELCLTVSSPQSCGIDAGAWCAHGGPADAPPDQRADDGRALCFTSEPLPERIEILGAPELTLDVAADRPVALVAARLCDVAPDGASSLITRGVLNIAHRDGHAAPEPLEPGRRYRVTLALDSIGQAVAAGHRLRLSISSTYWPWVWPSPERVTLSVFPAGSELALPVRAPRERDGELRALGEPERAAPLEVEVLRPAPGGAEVHRDLSTGEVEIVTRTDEGGLQRLVEAGLEMELNCTTRYRILDDDPLSARVSCTATSFLGRGPWRTSVEVHSVMDSDASTFRVTTAVDAYEGDARVLARRETFTTPRRLV